MNFKQIIQDYFTFSRNERKGITILLVIIFMLAVANKVIFYFETPAKIDENLLFEEHRDSTLDIGSVNNQTNEKKLFRFNPNTIDSDALDSLDLPENVKRNLLKFREKGGRLYTISDFKQIYGVTDQIYNQFVPFLIFENRNVPQSTQDSQSELFTFDPNTTSNSDFKRLGLTEKQIQTIRKYQNKGGIFREKKDFLKIYGISESQKRALTNYIIIKKKERLASEGKNEVEDIQIEINSTDSIELKKLPGIGSKLSKRIVKYRDLLGGYYSLAQLKEVFGLSEQVIQQINGMVKVDPTKVRKIDLNFTEWYELAKHPYIQKDVAKKIIKFRTKFGNIRNPEVLQDSMILNIDEYIRLKPYL